MMVKQKERKKRQPKPEDIRKIKGLIIMAGFIPEQRDTYFKVTHRGYPAYYFYITFTTPYASVLIKLFAKCKEIGRAMGVRRFKEDIASLNTLLNDQS